MKTVARIFLVAVCASTFIFARAGSASASPNVTDQQRDLDPSARAWELWNLFETRPGTLEFETALLDHLPDYSYSVRKTVEKLLAPGLIQISYEQSKIRILQMMSSNSSAVVKLAVRAFGRTLRTDRGLAVGEIDPLVRVIEFYKNEHYVREAAFDELTRLNAADPELIKLWERWLFEPRDPLNSSAYSEMKTSIAVNGLVQANRLHLITESTVHHLLQSPLFHARNTGFRAMHARFPKNASLFREDVLNLLTDRNYAEVAAKSGAEALADIELVDQKRLARIFLSSPEARKEMAYVVSKMQTRSAPLEKAMRKLLNTPRTFYEGPLRDDLRVALERFVTLPSPPRESAASWCSRLFTFFGHSKS